LVKVSSFIEPSPPETSPKVFDSQILPSPIFPKTGAVATPENPKVPGAGVTVVVPKTLKFTFAVRVVAIAAAGRPEPSVPFKLAVVSVSPAMLVVVEDAATAVVPNVIGKPLVPPVTAAVTNAVVAIVVLFVPGACVVVVGAPGKLGFIV
jgi:hypothetical protein